MSGGRSREDWGVRTDDATWAVVGHALLGSVRVIRAAAETLHDGWDDTSPEERREMLQMVMYQSEHIGGVLHDVMRGLPEQVVEAVKAARGYRDRTIAPQ